MTSFELCCLQAAPCLRMASRDCVICAAQRSLPWPVHELRMRLSVWEYMACPPVPLCWIRVEVNGPSYRMLSHAAQAAASQVCFSVPLVLMISVCWLPHTTCGHIQCMP